MGLNIECLRAKPLNIAQMVSECRPVEEKREEEPAAPVVELATDNSSSSGDDVNVDGVKLTGYTIGIIVIFCL